MAERVKVSADGRRCSSPTQGPGGRPNLVGESRAPKFTVLGTVNIIPTPSEQQLDAYTERV